MEGGRDSKIAATRLEETTKERLKNRRRNECDGVLGKQRRMTDELRVAASGELRVTDETREERLESLSY